MNFGVSMTTIRKTISFTPQHDAWIKARINSGEYASDSEYIRDLIRRDQQANERFQVLKTAIQEGLDSGVSNRQVTDIMQDVEKNLREDGKL